MPQCDSTSIVFIICNNLGVQIENKIDTWNKMSVLEPFEAPLHFEFFCLAYALAVIFEVYANFRQLRTILYQPTRLESDPKDNEAAKEAKRIINLQLGAPEYDKALQYQRDKLILTSARLVTVFFVVVAWLLFLGGPKLWELTEKLVGKRSIYVKSSLFMGLYLLADVFLELPFKLCNDFVLEERHGFNKKTPFLFFRGLLSGFRNLFLIWLAITCGLQFLRSRAKDSFLLYAFVALELSIFIGYFVYPFYTPKPSMDYRSLDNGELKSSVDKLAQKVGVSPKCIVTDETSNFTRHSNAYVYGIGFTRRIVFYNTILKQPKEQVLAVFAHELGHYKYHHKLLGFFLYTMHLVVVFAIAKLLKNDSKLYESFGYKGNDTVVVGLLLVLYIFYPFIFLVNILIKYGLRCMERQADEYAVKLGYGDQLVHALVNLFKNNKKAFYYDPFYAFAVETHPTIYKRLLCYLKGFKGHKVQ